MDNKTINELYFLFKRIIEGYENANKQLESHYKAVIETKDYTIDNLEVRLKTAMNHLKRIEEDRIKLK